MKGRGEAVQVKGWGQMKGGGGPGEPVQVKGGGGSELGLQLLPATVAQPVHGSDDESVRLCPPQPCASALEGQGLRVEG